MLFVICIHVYVPTLNKIYLLYLLKEEANVCPTSPLTPPSTFLIECLSVSSLLVCESTLCLHLPQCSELTCCCLIILCYAKLFIKKNLLLTMYYKENFMWNSIIVTTVRWIAINDLILYFLFFRF